jgi:hypothetical protein
VYHESEITSLFGVKEAKRVHQRHTGGTAGQKGTRFEDYFAVYKLAEHLGRSYDPSGKFRDPKKIHVHNQVYAFVDDVAVEFQASRTIEHYQLKNAVSVSWDAGSPSIKDDFNMQRKLCSHRGLTNRLYLVVPTDALRKKLDQKRVSAKVSCDRALHFPYLGFDLLVQSYKPFRNALLQISPFRSADVQTDKLLTLATYLLGTWISAPHVLAIGRLASQLEKKPFAFARPMGGNLPIPADVKGIFKRIQGFQFRVQKGFLFWSCGSADNGIYPYHTRTSQFRNLMKRIRKSRPRKFEQIEEQLV